MKSEPDVLQLDQFAVFLDFDGTLAALEERPEEVLPEPRRTHLLKKLQHQLEGRLAIVSGRSIEVLDFLTEDSVIALAGVHGLQRRTATGQRDDIPPHTRLAECFAELNELRKEYPELILEYKDSSLAVHFRQIPQVEIIVKQRLEALAFRFQLELQHGRAVVELKTPGRHKGDAVAAFMQESPFKGYRPVFAGDDLTDETAFQAVNALGGITVKVGEGDSVARYRLPTVESVLTWLEESCNE
ncbi:trehalose-phosphatase [Cellvibrio polysaccharolyticus]|uniref:Trehalose 6-phosphate phosphatase n=1 Tax=Cellvibrio polysaccharolyticus TaxID=2082724 RepID=A0A928V6W5_9GAMM|nr:trehalose-phosphatase [Cellvibrio polysaccharolyticus]MBE8717767.1 trehalose-phosphatase [Cellvibrio polysaccharolyticus]